MSKYKIVNLSNQKTIVTEARIANTFLSRMKGLLGRESLNPDEGLIITKCNSIHMFFMKFPIDVIFLNKNNEVVGLVENIKPNKLSRIFFRATHCIEAGLGTIKKADLSINDRLEFFPPLSF